MPFLTESYSYNATMPWTPCPFTNSDLNNDLFFFCRNSCRPNHIVKWLILDKNNLYRLHICTHVYTETLDQPWLPLHSIIMRANKIRHVAGRNCVFFCNLDNNGITVAKQQATLARDIISYEHQQKVPLLHGHYNALTRITRSTFMRSWYNIWDSKAQLKLTS